MEIAKQAPGVTEPHPSKLDAMGRNLSRQMKCEAVHAGAQERVGPLIVSFAGEDREMTMAVAREGDPRPNCRSQPSASSPLYCRSGCRWG